MSLQARLNLQVWQVFVLILGVRDVKHTRAQQHTRGVFLRTKHYNGLCDDSKTIRQAINIYIHTF